MINFGYHKRWKSRAFFFVLTEFWWSCFQKRMHKKKNRQSTNLPLIRYRLTNNGYNRSNMTPSVPSTNTLSYEWISFFSAPTFFGAHFAQIGHIFWQKRNVLRVPWYHGHRCSTRFDGSANSQNMGDIFSFAHRSK